MRADWLRALAVACFAGAAVLVGIGNSEHVRWLVGVAFGCFAAGVIAFLRWRGANRATVFARGDKTTPDEMTSAGEEASAGERTP